MHAPEPQTLLYAAEWAIRLGALVVVPLRRSPAAAASGMRIPRYRDVLLHAKNVTVDGELGIVGASNVDLRSFQLNEEASLLLYDAPQIERLEAVQAGYLAASDPLRLEAWRARPRWRRLTENVSRIMSPLL